jgi:superfamily II DNA or RNA helicase
MLKLRDYQSVAIHSVFEAWRQGARSVVLVAPTGCGKRIIALWLMDYAAKAGRRVLFVGNRRLLVTQAQNDAERLGMDYGVIMSDAESGNPGSTNQLASIQTLESWYFTEKWSNELTGRGLPPADLVVVDECFSGETEILTPLGPRRIDQVRSGDVVFSAHGIGTVQSVSCRSIHEIYKLEISDGSVIECTAEHPFLTPDGWCPACNMEGKVAYGTEAMCLLWSSVHSEKMDGGQQSEEGRHCPDDPAGEKLGQAGLLLSILCKEITQPNEQPSGSAGCELQTQTNQAQAYQAWRQRAITALGTACAIARARGRVGSGADGQDRHGQDDQRLSDVLQDRPCQSVENDRDRAGRRQPHADLTERAGRQEDGVSGILRVVRVSHHQCQSARAVFNLHVSGHPSYFANGVLVHNCHTEENRYRQLLQLYPDSKFLGLTATPVGTEGRAIVPRPYDVLVEPIKNSELISQGFLLPTKVYAPSEPNIEGVKVVKRGEYNQNQLGRAVSECTVFADVYSEWDRHAGGRATVAFVPGIPFGRDLARQFNFILGAGSAYLIEAKTKHAEREEIFQKIVQGEARILVSCDVLKEGFDLPCLSCSIDLQPNSQLRSYWQKLGRIKRPFGEQQDALLLDFAGNYWKFPHPNQDPIWPQGEEDTQQVIKAARKAGDQTQPIMCPKCLFVRERGPVCPQCGHTAGEAIRRIRMGHGKLKEIPAIQKVQREKTEGEKLFAKWQGRLFGAMHSGLSFAQCSALFLKETGQQPRSHWPGAFERDSVNWRKCPKNYYHSTRELAIALRRTTP